jgi:regulator of protease activity HflC (stomatin/prohibitin superfamily)
MSKAPPHPDSRAEEDVAKEQQRQEEAVNAKKKKEEEAQAEEEARIKAKIEAQRTANEAEAKRLTEERRKRCKLGDRSKKKALDSGSGRRRQILRVFLKRMKTRDV